MDAPVLLTIWAAGFAAVSGLPGLLWRRRGDAASLALLGGAVLCGLLSVLWNLVAGSSPVSGAWQLPNASLSLNCDGVSSLFLLPAILIPSLAALYGTAYWGGAARAASQGRLRWWLGLLIAAMAMLTMAANAVLFLILWEVMTLAGFFLIVSDDREAEVRRAGWVYLVATHAGTLLLLAGFALLAHATGSFDLRPLPHGFAASPQGGLAFILLLLGFGIKAGIMPLHFWLPIAHAAAPSHISAVLSGVMIKMGILGIVRLLCLVPDPPLWWGGVLAAIGASSGILGVAFAIGQHDLKRLLAYHSIENIGIIMMGLGLLAAGKALGSPELMLLGAAGALLHVLNHAIFKTLLFLAAGSVVHAAHTREMDLLGGLARPMPLTAGFFLVGAISICGLPPLNGFVSEWLIYLGAFHGFVGRPAWPWAAALVMALSLIGGLAAACFIKAFGAVFLGQPRHEHAGHASEATAAMLVPMGVLAAACAAIGLAPWALAPLLERAAAALGGVPATTGGELSRLAYLPGISLMAGALVVAGALLWLGLRRGSVAQTVTWDCGYAAPGARMQYTASSFASGLVQVLRLALWPSLRRPAIEGVFPRASAFSSEVPDTVLDRLLTPLYRLVTVASSWLRVLQAGSIQLYLLYVAMTLVALMCWVVV